MTEGEPNRESVPSDDELVALSRRHQQLALPMFVVSSFPAEADIAVVMETIPAHGGYWAELEQEGVLFAGGPVLSGHGPDPWQGHAMFIFRAQSLAAAHAIAEADPMHANGARQYELRPWLLNHLVVPDEAKP